MGRGEERESEDLKVVGETNNEANFMGRVLCAHLRGGAAVRRRRGLGKGGREEEGSPDDEQTSARCAGSWGRGEASAAPSSA